MLAFAARSVNRFATRDCASDVIVGSRVAMASVSCCVLALPARSVTRFATRDWASDVIVGSHNAMASDSCCVLAFAAKSVDNDATKALGNGADADSSGCLCARPAES